MKKKKVSQTRGRQFIMGKNCVQELLHFAPERIISIYTSKDPQKGDSFLTELEKRSMPIKYVSPQKLFSIVQSESHQSFVAEVKERPTMDLPHFFEQSRKKSVVLMLDSIYDPQNLGAILRAAECFAVDAVVWSKNRGTDITPVVSKASVGATELVPLIKVANLAETAKRFKAEGYQVVTAEIGGGAEPLYTFTFAPKTLLILGSEGKGVQKLISKHADAKVYIEMLGRIDSLNVAQATAVFLSHWHL